MTHAELTTKVEALRNAISSTAAKDIIDHLDEI